MKALTDQAEIERYQALVSEMSDGHHFRAEWVRRKDWKVVPVESAIRLPREDIPRLVSVLNRDGYNKCLAVATEDLGEMLQCYIVSIDEAGFSEFNRELGPFRFLLTSEERSWAISCSEWYNLFAGEEMLLEALLGTPIAKARERFLEFAKLLAHGDPTDPLIKVAEHYSQL